jgi:hypothetical protein
MKMEMEMSEGRKMSKGVSYRTVTGSVVCRKQLLVGKGPSSETRFRESGEFIISSEK